MMDIFKFKKIRFICRRRFCSEQQVLRFLAARMQRKFYVNCVAAGLRARDCVMTTATNIQENAEDILAEAKQINEARGYESFGEDEDFNETAEATEAAPEAEKAEQ